MDEMLILSESGHDKDCIIIEKCSSEHCREFDVFVPVTVKPFGKVDKDDIKVECDGDPRIIPGNVCHEHGKKDHEFTIAQKIKVLIPAEFGAEVCIRESCDEDLGSCQGVDPSSISLNHSSIKIKPNQTRQLIATVLPIEAKDKSVTWTSSNSTNVTVSANGLVTAVRKGNAIITAKTVNGLMAHCNVEVTDDED